MRRACFPEYLALVNPVAAQAYAMLFVEEKTFQAEHQITDSSGHPDFLGPREWSPKKSYVDIILDQTTQSRVCEAILIMSPYVKFLGKNTGLENASLSFRMDAESIIQRESLWNYVIREKKENSKSISYRSRESFYSCLIDKNNQADASHTYGVMAPNGSHLELLIHWTESKGDPVRVECGFTAALYTTDGGVERKIEALQGGS